MKEITRLIGRGEIVEKVVREVRKGRHVILTGPIGCGKSAVLQAALENLNSKHRREGNPEENSQGEQWSEGKHYIVYVPDNQAKGQFITIARRLLEAGVLDTEALELPERYSEIPPDQLDWNKIKRHVSRLSIRDLTSVIIPAIHDHPRQVVIAVDDMTSLTPTLVAFWLAVFDCAQVIGCANQKKAGLNRLWWKMTEVQVPPLPPAAIREIVRIYIQRKGLMIESPDLYIGHVVKQSAGNPQAVADMLEDSSKEKVVDKRKIREMRHAAGIRYLDFTPVMIVMVACVIGTRYVAIGTGDTALYVFAGIMAAIILSLRVFLFRGAGKAD